eukprot:m.93010 g.93010  ORF g.93010 m.93010 type:complete len:56 (-) comp14684_c2_seq2:478-645(-)
MSRAELEDTNGRKAAGALDLGKARQQQGQKEKENKKKCLQQGFSENHVKLPHAEE